MRELYVLRQKQMKRSTDFVSIHRLNGTIILLNAELHTRTVKEVLVIQGKLGNSSRRSRSLEESRREGASNRDGAPAD
jgi:hypothetical protein